MQPRRQIQMSTPESLICAGFVVVLSCGLNHGSQGSSMPTTLPKALREVSDHGSTQTVFPPALPIPLKLPSHPRGEAF